MNQINPKYLYAISLLAPKDDVRYYLNGVKVEFYRDKTRYIATNGHYLGLYEHETDNQTVGSIIIPTDLVKLFGKKKGIQTVEISKSKGDQSPRLSCPGVGAVVQGIEGHYPEYQGIFPRTTTGKPAAFDPEYVGLFAKVAKTLGVKPYTVALRHNSKGGAIVHMKDPNFLGVIMPVRAPEGLGPDDPWTQDQTLINLHAFCPDLKPTPESQEPIID